MGKSVKPQVSMKKVKQYLVVGRAKPTETDPEPKVYRMRVFAPNEVVAKSRFWTLMRKQKKIKHSHGEFIAIHQVLPPLILDTRKPRKEREGVRTGDKIPITNRISQHVQGIPRHECLWSH